MFFNIKTNFECNSKIFEAICRYFIIFCNAEIESNWNFLFTRIYLNLNFNLLSYEQHNRSIRRACDKTFKMVFIATGIHTVMKSFYVFLGRQQVGTGWHVSPIFESWWDWPSPLNVFHNPNENSGNMHVWFHSLQQSRFNEIKFENGRNNRFMDQNRGKMHYYITDHLALKFSWGSPVTPRSLFTRVRYLHLK